MPTAFFFLGNVDPFFLFKPIVQTHYFFFFGAGPYVPPRFLYSLTNHPFAYALGYTLNFFFASDLTLEYKALFLGTPLFATFHLIVERRGLQEPPTCIKNLTRVE